jgi:hypothetical protein
MRRVIPILCVTLLVGCSSSTPNFVKLDASGKKDLSANPEATQRDIADCKAFEDYVREDGGTVSTHRAPERPLPTVCVARATSKARASTESAISAMVLEATNS